MDRRVQIEQFASELDRLVARFAKEYELDAASVVGVLAFKQAALMHNANVVAELKKRKQMGLPGEGGQTGPACSDA